VSRGGRPRPFALSAAAIIAVLFVPVSTAPAGAVETAQFGLVPGPPGPPSRHLVEQVRPGHATSDTVLVFNKASTPLTLTLAVLSASVGANGAPQVGGSDQAVSWIELDRHEVRLPAGAAPGNLPSCTDPQTAATSTAPVVAQHFTPTKGSDAVPTGVVAKRLAGELIDDVRLRSATPGEVVLLSGGDVVLSTLGRDATAALVRATRDRTGIVALDGWSARVTQPGPGVPWTSVVAVRDDGGRNNGLFALILLAGGVCAGALVTVVARNLSRPYAEITAAAERVAGLSGQAVLHLLEVRETVGVVPGCHPRICGPTLVVERIAALEDLAVDARGATEDLAACVVDPPAVHERLGLRFVHPVVIAAPDRKRQRRGHMDEDVESIVGPAGRDDQHPRRRIRRPRGLAPA